MKDLIPTLGQLGFYLRPFSQPGDLENEGEQVRGRREALDWDSRRPCPGDGPSSALPGSCLPCLLPGASLFPSLPLAWPGRDFHLLFPHDTAAFPLTLSFYLKS